MTLTVAGAFQDNRVTQDEANSLIQDAALRKGAPAASTAAMKDDLAGYLQAGGLSADSAADAASVIVDAYAGKGKGAMQTLAFNPGSLTFDTSGSQCLVGPPPPPSPTGGHGFPDRLTAGTPDARQKVYVQISGRMQARLGGAREWSAMAVNAGGQVKDEIRSLEQTRAALKDLLSGSPTKISGALHELAHLATQDSAIGRATGVFMASNHMTAADLVGAGAFTAAKAMLPFVGGASLGTDIQTTVIAFDKTLGRMEDAFKEGNRQIFSSIATAYDQYDKGGAAAVATPGLRPAFEMLAKAETETDPVAKQKLLSDSTKAVARFEQTMIQPLFDKIADLMAGIPEIIWTPPGKSAPELLGNGRDWCNLESRLNLIATKVLPSFGLQ